MSNIEVAKGINGRIVRESYKDRILRQFGISVDQEIDQDKAVEILIGDCSKQAADCLNNFGFIKFKIRGQFQPSATPLNWHAISDQKIGLNLLNIVPHTDSRDFALLNHTNQKRKSLTGFTSMSAGVEALINSLDILINAPEMAIFKSYLEGWKPLLHRAISQVYSNHERYYEEIDYDLRSFVNWLTKLSKISDELLFLFVQSIEAELNKANALEATNWEPGNLVLISRKILHFRLVKEFSALWEKNPVLRSALN